jgi:hypothetical protein
VTHEVPIGDRKRRGFAGLLLVAVVVPLVAGANDLSVRELLMEKLGWGLWAFGAGSVALVGTGIRGTG